MIADYKDAMSRFISADGRKLNKRYLANGTRLLRGDNETVVLSLWGTNIVTFYPDGHTEIAIGRWNTWNTWSTKDRLSRFSPINVWTESGHLFCSYKGREYSWSNEITLYPDGTTNGADPKETRAGMREEYLRAKRAYSKLPSTRAQVKARYWVSKARAIEIVRCSKARWECDTRRRWQRDATTPGIKACGCVVTKIVPKLRKPITVADVLAETNASVRVAKMTLYGVDKFFVDANPTVINENAGYQLIELPVKTNSRWERQVALKMVCPSTGAVYINTVPPTTQSVSEGLDYMFQTENYLEKVGVQT